MLLSLFLLLLLFFLLLLLFFSNLKIKILFSFTLTYRLLRPKDVLTLDQEECANFLSDCGLAVVLTVSLILS